MYLYLTALLVVSCWYKTFHKTSLKKSFISLV